MIDTVQPELEKIETESRDIIAIARRPVASQEDYTLAAETMKTIQALLKAMESTFKPVIESAHKAHKEAVAAHKKHAQPLEEALAAVRKSAADWYTAELAAAQRRAEEERKAKAERDRIAAEEQAKLAAAEADLLGIDPAEMTAPEPVKPAQAAPVVAQEVSKGGLKFREVWKFRIVNPGAVPMEYKTIDEVKIGQIVRAMKNLTTIQGVEVYCEKVAY